MTFVLHLECSFCGKTYELEKILNLCTECSRPLIVRYNFESLRKLRPSQVLEQTRSMWRYRKLLPVLRDENIVSLS